MAKVSVAPNDFAGFDDGQRLSSGDPASAALFARMASAINAILNGGHVVRCFWGGVTADEERATRSYWPHLLETGRTLRGQLLLSKSREEPVDGQGISLIIDDGTTQSTWTLEMDYDVRDMPVEYYVYPGIFDHVIASVDDATFTPREVALGSLTANGPTIHSGLLYEPARAAVEPTETYYVPGDHLAPGSEIVATPVSGNAGLDQLRKAFLHAWNRKRPVFQWDSSAGLEVTFSTSRNEFRYIHAQSVGVGGTAPAEDGPGITIPLPSAGSGRNGTIKCAVHILAAMSGNVDHGVIGYSHRDGAGGMTTIAQPAGSLQVQGDQFAWYPALDELDPPTIELRTDLDYDRLVLCGMTLAAGTENLRIRAFALYPLHSTTIP